MNRLLPACLSLLALFTTACPEGKYDRPGPDAALAGPDAAAAEAPDAAMPPDAAAPGPDAGPVTPPLRTLLPAHLMGTAPVDNLVMAPNFDLGSEQWYAATGAMNYADAYLLELPRTPVNGLPVLKMAAEDEDERYLVGTVRGGNAPMLGSVWIGRDATASPELTLDVVIQGMTAAAAADETFVLAAETDSEQEIDGIRWVRYSGRIDSNVLGFGSFIVYDQTKQVVYTLAPALTHIAPTTPLTQVKAKPSIRRRPTLGEAKAVKHFWDWQHKKAPPPRYRP